MYSSIGLGGIYVSASAKEPITIPDGLRYLVEGYAEYAKEVIIDRAIVNIDGLKPVQRRILYTMKAKGIGIKDLTKSQTICGQVAEIHPHGEISVYDSLTRLVDSAEYLNVPYLEGKGWFGRVYSTEAAAAKRYTDCRLTPIAAEELFREMDGVKFVPSYDNRSQEPELLPVSFPTVLVNATSGIAVGVASNIPSFNFHEVNNAVIELIETGDIKGYLIPDFTTKGYYVYNEDELRKIMTTGRGRIKLRGKWYVDGKTIYIEEIPYYTTVNAIMKDIKEIPGVADVRDETDRNGLKVAVECSNKRVVDQVLTEILRTTEIQKTIMTNIVVIVNNKPRVLGVKDLLKEWVEFRVDVLRKQLSLDLERVKDAIAQYEMLISLLNDTDKRTEFTEVLAKKGEKGALSLLMEWFPNQPKETFDWILEMKLRSFSNVSSKMKHLEELKKKKAEIERDLKDVKQVIVRQLRELNKKYSFPRRTQVTHEDIVFDKVEVIKPEPVPVVVVIDGKFIKKMKKDIFSKDLPGIHCMSDDVISFIDTKGRLLRVNLENIEFAGRNDKGVYLPVYLEVEDDFDIVAYDLVEDKQVGYVYADGFVSVVDYGEWVDSKRLTRITTNGVSPLAHLIVGEIDLSKAYVLLITKSGRFGFAPTNFKRKHRTARTKLINVKEGDEIVTVVSLDYPDVLRIVSRPENYLGKLKLLSGEDTFNSEYLAELLGN